MSLQPLEKDIISIDQPMVSEEKSLETAGISSDEQAAVKSRKISLSSNERRLNSFEEKPSPFIPPK